MENQPPYQQSSNFPSMPVALPNSTAVLVLGIISIVGCFCYGIVGLVCGIIAVVLSNKDLKYYRLDPESYTSGSYSNLKAGRVCAIIGLCLSALYMVIVIIYISIIGTAFLTHPQYLFNHS